MNRKVTTVLRVVPLAAAMGTIFLLSHQPGDRLSLPSFPGADKLAHMTAYGILAGTVFVAFSERWKKNHPRRVVVFTVLFCLVYGISDEFHQSFIPGRSTSILDVLADCGGAALACAVWARWRKRIAMINGGQDRTGAFWRS